MPNPLDPTDLKFLEKRRWLVTRWNPVGTCLFVGLAIFAAWMFRRHPRLVNPLHVFNELQEGGIPQSTLEIMAAMLPIFVFSIFMVLAMAIAFVYAMIGNERRYLKIIDRLRTEKEPRE